MLMLKRKKSNNSLQVILGNVFRKYFLLVARRKNSCMIINNLSALSRISIDSI